ncbi:EamA family transporter [Yersinia pseudotuberculosis]|uniref:Putative inner membrane protein n=1 Tax=Yersinia pseudotuberculosis TaxID=633 RepID=A0A380QB67_YERPU|nr:DMT family transporter [Yersinia pseudotuberculosis]PSH16780.1 EamA family transporter [Yersinia pseudotuberculosis]SUP83578.1 putative inner membrane protein [Yersinia pseudotuberculosis]
MSSEIFLAVLGAALLHACWNGLVKFGTDRLVAISLMAIFSGFISLPGIFLVGFPSLAALPWLLLSVVFHTGYCLFLSKAYEKAEFGQIYPIARGVAPLLSALLSWLVLSEIPRPLALLGAFILVFGVIMITFDGRKGVKLSRKAIIYALITATFTACYTLSDGAGSRASIEPLSYIFWLFMLNGLAMFAVLWLLHRNVIFREIRQHWYHGLIGGTMQLLAYGIVIWAMKSTPIALVAALRETSVLFAMVISVWMLKEKPSGLRLAASLVIMAGVVVTKFG